VWTPLGERLRRERGPQPCGDEDDRILWGADAPASSFVIVGALTSVLHVGLVYGRRKARWWATRPSRRDPSEPVRGWSLDEWIALGRGYRGQHQRHAYGLCRRVSRRLAENDVVLLNPLQVVQCGDQYHSVAVQPRTKGLYHAK
jgi:hypothetical protein